MAKITRITTQKKSKSRYNIFLDYGQGEEYTFSVDEDILIKYHLRKGLELDKSMIKTLVENDSLHKVYALAVNYLSYRMRSTKEVKNYLIKKEYDLEQVPQVVDRLISENLLNDEEFAESYVRTKINTSSKGPLLIKKELLEKGITTTIADQVVKLYTHEQQFEKAMKYVNKKISTSSKKSFRQQLQGLQQTLIQKGFTQQVIQEVITEIQSEQDDNSEWEAVVYQGEKLFQKYRIKSEGYELKHKVKAGLYRKGFTIELIDRFIEEIIEAENV